MRYLRTLSTSRLLALVLGVVVLAVAGVAVASAALSGGSKPPPQALDKAVHQALAAPAVQGITARIQFTNHLFDGASLAGNQSAAITGATGRAWLTKGHIRLELQSSAGDMQIQSDGKTVTAYDASSNTLYRLDLGSKTGSSTGTGSATESSSTNEKANGGIPSLAEIDKALAHLGQNATVSGATPTNVAGQPSYSVRLSPKHDGGLLGGAQLVWDAARGVPLRIAVYAQGQSSPVLQLTATDISYGALPASSFAITPPAKAHVVDLNVPSGAKAHDQSNQKTVEGVAAVRQAVTFPLSSPDTLVGLGRQHVSEVNWKGTPGAALVYGKGLGALIVLEQPADASSAAGSGGPLGQLPSVSISGTTAHELATPLGTVLTFQKGGTKYTVAGSLPAVAAETAARELAK
jgi:outer membrane lipoprotein-sorting protein